MANALLICPLWMDIYKDIKTSLSSLGYTVDYLSEVSNKRDPRNQRCVNPYTAEEYKKILGRYWVSTLNSDQYQKVYDLLFVVDGQGLQPIVFDILKKRNKDVFCVNYLFDTISGVYHFEDNFHFFNKVYTFDMGESIKYKINFLPIYWKKDSKPNIRYKFFGFGSYIQQRFELFEKIERYASMRGFESFIKILAYNRYPSLFYDIRRIYRKLVGLYDDHPTFVYESPLAYNHIMSPDEFRDYIYKSEIVIDTAPKHQDGLTARFMWALGAGKKIITTNANIIHYPFFSDRFIFIVDDITDLENNKEFDEFVQSKYAEDKSTRILINEYRIDNWLKEILSR